MKKTEKLTYWIKIDPFEHIFGCRGAPLKHGYFVVSLNLNLYIHTTCDALLTDRLFHFKYFFLLYNKIIQ